MNINCLLFFLGGEDAKISFNSIIQQSQQCKKLISVPNSTIVNSIENLFHET